MLLLAEMINLIIANVVRKTEAVGNARGAHNVLLDIAGVPLDVVKEKEEQMNRNWKKMEKILRE